MIRSAITVSLVEEARGGPFVLWDGLDSAFETARSLGFDAVEIFAPGPDAVDRNELHRLVEATGLRVAAVGTGAGMVKHGLSLSDPDPAQREKAAGFIRQMIDFGAEFECSAIIGSMQGQASDINHRSDSLHLLADGLSTLGDRAMQNGQVLLYEALNRYETNLLNTQEDAANFLIAHDLVNKGVRLLCDLFHMNIEEVDVAETITRLGSKKQDLIGHIHWADSNRRAMGFGHTDSTAIYQALKAIGYDRYLAAEVFPLPSPAEAANQTIASIKACASS